MHEMEPLNPEDYNEDELVPPDWLDETFLEQMLQHRRPNVESQIKIWNLRIRPASLKGDHYSSLMFRVAYEYSHGVHTDEESVIVKAMPDADTDKGRNLADAPIFETEVSIYSEMIPAFEEIWRQHGEEIKFAGRLLYAATEPVRVIVLEDLCRLGYVTLRGRPFMLNEVQRIFCKLAKWHAASHKLAVEPQAGAQRAKLAASMTQLQHGLFKMRQLMASPAMANGLRTLIEVLEEECGDEAEYAATYLPKLRALEPQLVARCIAMQEAYNDAVVGPIYVLNHGDFHANNIMFRPASDDATEFLFVDFQVNFFGTSTYDVRFAMFTLVGQAMRDIRREELLFYYFRCFVESLKKLKFCGKMPTYSDFKADWLLWRCYELYCIFTLMPTAHCSEGAARDVDINRVFTCEKYRKTFYKQPRYLNKVKQLLPELLTAGYLDE